MLNFAEILKYFAGVDKRNANIFAGRIYQMKDRDEPDFIAALSSIAANPEMPLSGAYAQDLEPIRIQVSLIIKHTRSLIPREQPLDYRIFGAEVIEEAARKQMNDVMRLSPVVGGALMPDAHPGYGIPIGGVVAVDNAVIPYAVGVDIGCRMHLTVFNEPYSNFEKLREKLRHSIMNGTYFGKAMRSSPIEHALLDDPRIIQIENYFKLPEFRKRAGLQLGTSGSGNHFVEFGELRLDKPTEGIPAGNWIALLSHSGSRALGFKIANHFCDLATKVTPLAGDLKRLAWLSMETEEGRAYWDAMQLAGEYSALNHEVIHDTVSTLSGLTPLLAVSNHHNFAWKENHGGRDLYLHRKGATPAGPGVLGIIPGSMGTPGYLVRGLGSDQSLNSASHGAGRKMSRTQATKEISSDQRDAQLKAAGVELLGGGLDEAPGAYKDIRQVIAAQSDLVEVLAEFNPKIVRMAGAEKDPEEGN
jgi:tRNA-splicing ligase RtcB